MNKLNVEDVEELYISMDLVDGIKRKKAHSVIADLQGIFEWAIFEDGTIIVDPKYIDEWRKHYEPRR